MNPLIPSIVSGIINSVTDVPATDVPPSPQGVVRPLPQGTSKAVMAPPDLGYARFGNKVLRLAPGLQIRNSQNLLVQPMTLQQPVTVRYLVDAGGDVSRIWILTPAEAVQPDQ